VTLIVARGLRYIFWGALGIVYGDEAVAMLRQVDRWFGTYRIPLILTVVAAVAVSVAAIYTYRRLRAPADASGAR
jgi:hypothetical protein